MPASNLRIYPFVKHNQPELFEKLEKHGVTIQDVLHVCREWEVFHEIVGTAFSGVTKYVDGIVTINGWPSC